jgi:hypothetical protein
VAAVIARVTGTALTPGISRNGRLYTREAIAKAVKRAQGRIADGKRPISMRSHHQAGDDSTHIAGAVSRMWQDPDSGAAKYEGGIADTAVGRDIAALTDDTDGQPQHLRGVSIRGAWMEEPRMETVDGRDIQTADDLEIQGIDFTAEPGVDDADVRHLPVGSDEDAPDARFALAESVADTMLTAHVQEKGAEPLKSGKPAAAPTKATVYADPGYQGDKAKRYALDTKKQAKAAWAFINQADNAKDYTAAQLKRIKQRIVKALKGFGVEVNTAEHYLVEPVTALTESTTLAECMGCYGEQDPHEAGSFYVTLTNGPVTVSVSSYRVDPADLDLIGRAAMDGACKALAALDPDMDGDIDAPGADAEDTDHDMASANVPGTACPCGCGCAIPLEPGDCPRTCVCAVCGDGEPMAEDAPDAVETAPDPAAAAVEPAPQAAADPTTETEEPAVSEPTTAVEPTQAAPAPSAVTLSGEQFAQLLAAASAPRTVEAAPASAAPVVEAAPAAPAPVAETQEQRIERLISDGITAGVQKLVSTGALNPGRKGLTGRPVTETGEEATLTEHGVPEDWPQKPLHTYTAEERRKYIDNALAEHVLGDSLYTGKR